MADRTALERIATQVVQNVCELPDYNSPDDQPELVMCTVTELHNCVMRALESESGVDSKPTAPASKTVTSRATFAKNRNDPCTWVLYLLEDGQISVGKAAEWLREYINEGKEGTLPDVSREPAVQCVWRDGCRRKGICLVQGYCDAPPDMRRAAETTAKPARDADHCDFPDCEQHYRYIAMQLDKYAFHMHECARLRDADPDSPTYGKCTCGLDALVKALKDSPEKSGDDSHG